MESGIRIGFSLMVAGSMVLGAARIEQRWIKSVAGDLWDLPGTYQIAEREESRGVRIDEQSQAMTERLARKYQIADAVRKGKMSLSEAADQFLAAAKGAPYEWDVYRQSHSHLPLRARCALLVVDDVECLVEGEEKNSTTIGARLRGQVDGWHGQ